MKKNRPIVIMRIFVFAMFFCVSLSFANNSEINQSSMTPVEKNLPETVRHFIRWKTDMQIVEKEKKLISKKSKINGLEKIVFRLVEENDKTNAINVILRIKNIEKTLKKQLTKNLDFTDKEISEKEAELEIMEKLRTELEKFNNEKKLESLEFWLKNNVNLSPKEINFVFKNENIKTTMLAVFECFSANNFSRVENIIEKMKKRFKIVNLELEKVSDGSISDEYVEEFNLIKVFIKNTESLMNKQKSLSKRPWISMKIIWLFDKISYKIANLFASTLGQAIIFPFKLFFKSGEIVISGWLNLFEFVKTTVETDWNSLKTSLKSVTEFFINGLNFLKPAAPQAAAPQAAAAAYALRMVGSIGSLLVYGATFIGVPLIGIYGRAALNYCKTGNLSSWEYDMAKGIFENYSALGKLDFAIKKIMACLFVGNTTFLNTVFRLIPQRVRLNQKNILDFIAVIVRFIGNKANDLSNILGKFSDEDLSAYKIINKLFKNLGDLIFGKGFSGWAIKKSTELPDKYSNNKYVSFAKPIINGIKGVAIWTYYASSKTIVTILEAPFNLLAKRPWLQETYVKEPGFFEKAWWAVYYKIFSR